MNNKCNVSTGLFLFFREGIHVDCSDDLRYRIDTVADTV